MGLKKYPSRLEILEYFDFRNGVFYWKKLTTNAVKIGDEAGIRNDKGYVIISFKNCSYRAHKLVWILEHNEPPPDVIDHINRCRWDNRPQNLRRASRSENAMNAGKRSHNSSGFKGVHKHNNKKWRAQIRFRNKRYCLGIYETAHEAHAAYLKAAKKIAGNFANGGKIGI